MRTRAPDAIVLVQLMATCCELAAAALVAQKQQVQSTSGERPRLIPLVSSDLGYSQNSSVNILCTVSQGHHESLTFDWFKDGQLIKSSDAVDDDDNFNNGRESTPGIQIDKHSDHSLLRIGRVQVHHSGRYACAAKSQFGEDSSSTNIHVTVKLQWIKEPPSEVVVSLNQELKLDCLAQGEPRPEMRWQKLDARHATSNNNNNNKLGSTHLNGGGGGAISLQAMRHSIGSAPSGQVQSAAGRLMVSNSSSENGHLLVSSSRHLTIQRARESDSGLYECVASNLRDADLRKLVHVTVRVFEITYTRMMDSKWPNNGRLVCLHWWLFIGACFVLHLFAAQFGTRHLFVAGQQNGEHLAQANQNNNVQNDNKIYSNSNRRAHETNTLLLAGNLNNINTLRLANTTTTTPLKVQYVNANNLPVLVQFSYVGPPKVLPIATADSYPESSSINLICTVSAGERRALTLSWSINGEQVDTMKLSNNKRDDDNVYSTDRGYENVAISADDSDISILKIKNATLNNAGRYTCMAKNQLGQDETSVDIKINVDMKWVKTPRDLVEIGVNQDTVLECDASGSPQPTIQWHKHTERAASNGTQLVSNSKFLKISRAQYKDSAMYECIARNNVHGDLRKIVQVKVRDTFIKIAIMVDNLEEVKLFRLPSERERYDNLADVYSLINCIQCLEKAYIKDAVTSREYTAACSKLLTQFKAAFKQIDKEFGTAEQFLKKYRFECRAALDRIREDRPITIKDDKGNTHACIAEIVSTFITISDRLKLGMKSMDELLPDLKELHETMGRLTILPSTYEGSNRVKCWIDKMAQMSASDELNENEIRQMTFDMDTSLNEFNKILLEK